MGQFQTEAGGIHQRHRQHIHGPDAQVVETGEPLLELLQPQTERRLAAIADLLQRFRELARHGQHVAHLLLTLALRDDQVLFQRVEVAHQEIGGEEVTHLAEIIIKADHVDPLVRLELIRLLGEEGELDAVPQVGLADTPNRGRQAIPLLGIQDAIAEKFEILERELMAQEGGLALKPATTNPACRGGHLRCCNHPRLCWPLRAAKLEADFSSSRCCVGNSSFVLPDAAAP